MKPGLRKFRWLLIGLTLGIGAYCFGVAFDPPALMQPDASGEPYMNFGWALAGALFIVAGLIACAHWPDKRSDPSRQPGRVD